MCRSIEKAAIHAFPESQEVFTEEIILRILNLSYPQVAEQGRERLCRKTTQHG